MLKFHDDPTVNKFEIVVWWYAEKIENFWKRRRENEIERNKKRREKIVEQETR